MGFTKHLKWGFPTPYFYLGTSLTVEAENCRKLRMGGKKLSPVLKHSPTKYPLLFINDIKKEMMPPWSKRRQNIGQQPGNNKRKYTI